MKPTFSEEKKLWQRGFKFVVGVDEVGRGAFAGPVVAAAVVFQPKIVNLRPHEGQKIIIDDSKKLKPRQREKSAIWIKENAIGWGIGEVGPSFINRLHMARATKMAFRQAIADCQKKLKIRLDFLLIDAFYVPYVRGLRRKHQKAIINGDQKSFSIAAASIVAKVYRDKLMQKLGRKYTGYGWGRNKGYGTSEHQKAIKRYGLTRWHRKDFLRNLTS